MESSPPLTNLLSIHELTRAQLLLILATAQKYKSLMAESIRYQPVLHGKTIGLLFYEPSTRTRCSFELACRYLGAHYISIAKAGSSFVKGETLKDTVWNLRAMGVDLLVMRHPVSGAAHYLSQKLDIPIVNAGDGMHAHPTQALLDIFTMQEHIGTLENKVIAIVGDIRHSRVARSNIQALTKLGAQVRLVAPPTFIPPGIEQLGAKVYQNIEEALSADIIMALRIQKERQLSGYIPSTGEYARLFGLNQSCFNTNSEGLIMHPGPINRGVELTSEIADSNRSLILKQIPNGVAVRMAILATLLGGHQNE